MTISTRPPLFSEHDEMQLVADAQFVVTPGLEILDRLRAQFEPLRSVIAIDDITGDIVGAAKVYSVALTVPGGAIHPAGVLDEVGVLLTHRRRGALTAMLGDHFAELTQRGELFSLLKASESSIYPSFGFGCRHDAWTYEFQSRASKFLPGAQSLCDGDAGSLRMIRPAEWHTMLPTLYSEWTRQRGAGVVRGSNWWALHYFASAAVQQGDSSGVMVIGHFDQHGVLDGFASYSGSGNWDNGIRSQRLQIYDLAATNPVAYLRLWRALLDHDLVDTICLWNGDSDEPIRWALADPRRMATTSRGDGWYIRLVNIEGGLNARTYESSEPLLMGVVDRHLPANTGVYQFADGVWTRGTAEPELSLDVSEVGAIFFGQQSVSALVSVGRVIEHVPGSAVRADRIFLSPCAAAR